MVLNVLQCQLCLPRAAEPVDGECMRDTSLRMKYVQLLVDRSGQPMPLRIALYRADRYRIEPPLLLRYDGRDCLKELLKDHPVVFVL